MKYYPEMKIERVPILEDSRGVEGVLWDELTLEQSNDSYRRVYLQDKDANYPQCKKLVRWLKKTFPELKKEDSVFVGIMW